MRAFKDRTDAGRRLASLLGKYRGKPGLIVLALPRGGVPVGFEVSRALEAPLDVLIVRKLGVPGYEELAMGAIATGGIRVVNEDVVNALGITDDAFEAVVERELNELERWERQYRGERPAPKIEGRPVVLVDNGIATGSTMLAAIRAVRSLNPERIVVAIPVAPREICDKFRQEADEVVSVLEPEQLLGVGWWYEDFSQTTDEEVRSLLEQAAGTLSSPVAD